MIIYSNLRANRVVSGPDTHRKKTGTWLLQIRRRVIRWYYDSNQILKYLLPILLYRAYPWLSSSITSGMCCALPSTYRDHKCVSMTWITLDTAQQIIALLGFITRLFKVLVKARAWTTSVYAPYRLPKLLQLSRYFPPHTHRLWWDQSVQGIRHHSKVSIWADTI